MASNPMRRRSGRLRRLCPSALAVLLAAQLANLEGASPEAGVVPPAWTLAVELCDPETAVYDRQRDQLYVSNICEWALDGDGFLSRVGLDGELLEARWIDGFDAPAGMALLGDRLYVADFERLRVIDVAMGRLVESLDLEAGALNDVAVAADGTLYISDSAHHRVLRLDERGAHPVPEAAVFTNANGLLLLEDTLWVGGEKLWHVDLASGEVVEAGPPGLADIDGIESDGAGGLVVSVVGGPIWHLPAAGEVTVWTTAGLSSTNHLYLPEQRLVVVPTGFDDTLVAFHLP